MSVGAASQTAPRAAALQTLTHLRDHLLQPLAILRGYQRADVGPDLVAGLTVAAFAVPQAMAYASIAELPPQVGLYTAVVATVVAALWGSSRYLSTGPTNAKSLLVLSVLIAFAAPGTPQYLMAAGTVAVLSGLFLVALAMLRLGALVTLASRSVLLGFTAGAGVLIGLGQLRHLLGLDLASVPELHLLVLELLRHVGATHLPSLGLGLGTLALLLLLRRISPRIPAALVSIVVAGFAVWLGELDQLGVRVVGAIPRSLPPLTWQSSGLFPDFATVRALALGSLAAAALGLFEAIAIAQALARERGERIDNNQEFFGQGLANIAAGLFSGYPCSGSFTRSALNHQAGARTQLSGLFAGLSVLGAMLVFAPWARFIPRAALAAVVLVVAWHMVDRRSIRMVFKVSRPEAAVMVATFGATLLLPLEFAILSGILLALGLFVLQASLPQVYPVVPDPTFRHFVEAEGRPTCPQAAVIAIQGPLFFGAVHHLSEVLDRTCGEHHGPTTLVLRMHGVPTCDLSGLELLESLVKRMRQLGGDLFLIRPRRPVLEIMRASGFLPQVLGEDHILAQEGAVEHLFEHVLDPAVCIYECEHRVFAECQALTKHAYDAAIPPAAAIRHHVERLVEPADLRSWKNEHRGQVLDVREPSEYQEGHIPQARLLPLRLLVEEAGKLDKDSPLLLVCRSGRRSARASHILGDLGFDKVYNLRGGILAWRAADLPIASGPDLGGEPG